MKIILHTLVAFSIFSSIITVAFAAEGGGIILLEPSVVNAGENSRVQFGQYMSTLFTTFITVAAVLAVLMIVIGGIQYITSFSGSGKEQGRVRITNAIFGLLLAVSAFLILQTVNPDLVSSDTLSLDIGKFSRIVSTSDNTGDSQYTEESWGKCHENGFSTCRPLTNTEKTCAIFNINGETQFIDAPIHSCPDPGKGADGKTRADVKCCGKPLSSEEKRHIYESQIDKTNCYRGPFNNKAECDAAHDRDTVTAKGGCFLEETKRAERPLQYCEEIENEKNTPQAELTVRNQLKGAGISINRANGCYDKNGNQISYKIYSDRYGGGCTSVGGLPSYAVNKVISLKDSCGGCGIIVTGGSELGHSTHGPGQGIVDLHKDPALNSYITSKAVNVKQTSLGPKYTLSDGSTYLDEVKGGGAPHWHVVFSEQ